MITTREINVNLSKEKLKLRQISTKDVDAGVRVEPPKEPIKARGVSTTTQADVADIVEKKRRDDIAVEKKLAMADEKKIAQLEPEIITAPAIVKDGKGKHIPTVIVKSKADETKKPWNKMNAKERKEHQAKKAKERENG